MKQFEKLGNQAVITHSGYTLSPDEWGFCPGCGDDYLVRELWFWNDEGAGSPKLCCPGCDADVVSLA
jgi:hypothetical protein